MSLFKDSMRPPSILSDEAVERYLAGLRHAIEPDPLFTRRLRGQVVNRFVAVREHHLEAPRTASRMGRLGRACLYASFVLGISVSGVMAASQESLPGDVLYSLKLQIEHLRVEVLPASLHDQLAAYSLGERIEEMGRLSERGDWPGVTALAGTIEEEYQELLVADAESSDAALHKHVVVLNALFERLPEPARIAVQDVLGGAPGIPQAGPPQAGTNNGGTNNGGGNNGGTNNGGGNNGGGNSGGENNGRTNNGGTNNGGTNNAGTNSGGTNNGGTNNGAANNEGANNGGTDDSGGTNNGGTNNGGANNGNNGEVPPSEDEGDIPRSTGEERAAP